MKSLDIDAILKLYEASDEGGYDVHIDEFRRYCGNRYFDSDGLISDIHDALVDATSNGKRRTILKTFDELLQMAESFRKGA